MTETIVRPAASVILLAEGPSVLMGLRGAGHRFMPNRLVFPGGAVDPGDAEAPAAAEMNPASGALLHRLTPPPLARALAMAAARELEEETGLSFGAPPRLDGLDYLCRAITPPHSPIRFDARFFVADAATTSGSLTGSGELEGLRYYELAEALTLDLALVTHQVLRQLTLWLAMDKAARAERPTTPLFSERRWLAE